MELIVLDLPNTAFDGSRCIALSEDERFASRLLMAHQFQKGYLIEPLRSLMCQSHEELHVGRWRISQGLSGSRLGGVQQGC